MNCMYTEKEERVYTKTSCIKVCQLDPSGSYCVGCNRTTDDIFKAGFSKTNNEDMERLDK